MTTNNQNIDNKTISTTWRHTADDARAELKTLLNGREPEFDDVKIESQNTQGGLGTYGMPIFRAVATKKTSQSEAR